MKNANRISKNSPESALKRPLQIDTNQRKLKDVIMEISVHKNIQASIDADGILLARIDMPGRSMNVFSLDMMDALEQLLNHVETTAAVRGVVLTSGKATFLVGADLDMIRVFTEQARTGTVEALHELCGRLGRLFRRLETSSKPYIAAVNGLALGGGLELALACHERVALDDDKTVQLGLPEIKLGLLPGAGGTQRLPRLIDTGVALKMLLTGVSASASRALELGLVDELAKPDQLLEVAQRRARALATPCARWDAPGYVFAARIDASAGSDAIEIKALNGAQKIAEFVGVSDQQRARYPAYDAILKCVVGGAALPMTQASHWEMDVFIDLIRDPVAGNMVRTLFLNRQRAAKEGQAPKALANACVAVTGPGAAALSGLLTQGKAVVIDEGQAGPYDILVATDAALAECNRPCGPVRMLWLNDTGNSARPELAGCWLSDVSEHGRALEIVLPRTPADHAQQADAGRKLAQWLRATVLISSGGVGFLAAMAQAQKAARQAGWSEDNVVLAVALSAAAVWLQGDAQADVELIDVAAVLAGLHPAYTGGPFTYLMQTGREKMMAAASAAPVSTGLAADCLQIDRVFDALDNRNRS